ncbi:MAG: hypothetical protein OXR68_01610 [Alphaproteobacteria bacterium]|nr:hypothetical protein [Alphaproteobacteria bacterium]
MSSKKSQFQARLENQKAQLERHGNFAEVVIRTTPEGTDMINFARLWEYVLVQADRQTRGYVAKSSRDDFEQTRQDFQDSVDFMVSKLKSSIERHGMDLTGSNFISRVAQRYSIAERKRKQVEDQPEVQEVTKTENKQTQAAKPAESESNDLEAVEV